MGCLPCLDAAAAALLNVVMPVAVSKGWESEHHIVSYQCLVQSLNALPSG
jgi:hypothetical protein